MPDDIASASSILLALQSTFGSTAIGSATAAGTAALEPGIPGAVLRAVAAMARASKRQQAELGVALRRAGLELSRATQVAAVEHLRAVASISDVVELDDGGVLLSVTAAGMERASR